MNGIPILDAIPVNWFILGTSVLAGVILFLILTQIPDDEEETENKIEEKSSTSEMKEESKPRLASKKKSSKR
ncbi:hypothetical protein A2721_01700 [Candidatus Gottesmanbacteria bacterium RIFCSPHIGHO2_01_FULL_47_48]|uniref:Uncharacterized protein n=1 Tax=Candidatus Gottesmanbacteria bacterium RIFCSPHIGHO2_01_FULL_47_48 TaxID=1798381 RepID=A0A1F6A1D4_9BACT|nr:MAG: hypothetical protein A2721_01700 [Candidatus Gottesmanbacteria bacterium RIFCSPHIGHO2_01_FULL_47_48]